MCLQTPISQLLNLLRWRSARVEPNRTEPENISVYGSVRFNLKTGWFESKKPNGVYIWFGFTVNPIGLLKNNNNKCLSVIKHLKVKIENPKLSLISLLLSRNYQQPLSRAMPPPVVTLSRRSRLVSGHFHAARQQSAFTLVFVGLYLNSCPFFFLPFLLLLAFFLLILDS